MPLVYFEEYELTLCPWCGSVMLRSIVEVLCVDCSMFFTERLHPSVMWKEQTSEISVVSACDKTNIGDSVHDHSDSVTSFTRASDIGAQTVITDTGGYFSSGFQTVQPLTMYDKLTEALQTIQEPFLLEEDLWVELVRSDLLSKCWLTVAGGDGLVQFGVPELQCLSQYFTVEATMGFFIINCTTGTTLHVCNLGNVQSCDLRCAFHYLRNYPRHTIGFVRACAKDGCEEIAVVQCVTSERNFRDRYRFHAAQAIMDRMLKVLICRYDHVVFSRGPMK